MSSRDVSDFVYSLITELARQICEAPDLFTGALPFLEVHQSLQYIHETALENALVDFVTRYRHAVESRSGGDGDVVRPDPVDAV